MIVKTCSKPPRQELGWSNKWHPRRADVPGGHQFFSRPCSPLGRRQWGSNPGRWHREPKAQPLRHKRSWVLWWVLLTCVALSAQDGVMKSGPQAWRWPSVVISLICHDFHEPSRLIHVCWPLLKSTAGQSKIVVYRWPWGFVSWRRQNFF